MTNFQRVLVNAINNVSELVREMSGYVIVRYSIVTGGKRTNISTKGAEAAIAKGLVSARNEQIQYAHLPRY